MTSDQKTCIIVYSLVMLQCAVTMTVIYIRSRKSPTLYSLCLAQLLVVLWLFFGMIENMSRTTEELLFSVRLTLFPISLIGGFWLLFALFYTEMIRVKNKLGITLIFAPLVLTYLPALTQNFFFLTIRSKLIENPETTVWGAFSIANFTFTAIYISVSIVIILIKSIKDFNRLKGKVGLIVLAVAVCSLVAILNNFIINYRGFDLTPVSFSITFLLIAIAVFKYRFFDSAPLLAMEIFRNLDEAVILLDSHDHIVEFNKAAVNEFSSHTQMQLGKEVRLFFNELKEKSADLKHFEEIIQNILNRSVTSFDTQIDLLYQQNDQTKKRYLFYYKTILSEWGQELGRIISFKDNTAPSMLLLENERNRISGDIHDNLSNMINVVSMNLEYVLKHYGEKKDDKAYNCIITAYDTAKDIRINLRRILEELEPLDMERVGLFNALDSMFKKVDRSGTLVEFFRHDVDEKTISNKEHAYVIYKTCMEALNNSLFSGKAKKITFVLSLVNNYHRLLITDDGVGCDLLNKGRGLTGMEKRIHAIGGSVAFESSLGEGFSISVQLPC